LNAPEISQGQSYTINLSAGGSAFFRNKYWRVWIDFNQDGDFNDAGEQVASTNSTSYGTLSASILVPGGGPLGYTRMRVSMKYGAYASTCETFSNGEVEDYLVNIADPNGGVIGRGRTTTEATAAVDGTPASEIEIYPNPVRNVLNISGADATSLIQIKNALGQELYKGALREQLDVESWAAGVYLLQIRSGKEVRLIRFVKE
jgi:bacillolysin